MFNINDLDLADLTRKQTNLRQRITKIEQGTLSADGSWLDTATCCDYLMVLGPLIRIAQACKEMDNQQKEG